MNGIDDVVYAKQKPPKNNVSIGFSNHSSLSLPKMWHPPSPKPEEEAINKAQQYDLIYAQSGYLYTVIPDAPRPVPFGQDKPGMSHGGWIDWYHNTPQSVHPTTTYVWYTPISIDIWRAILLPSSPLPTTISCFSPSTHEWTLVDTHDAPDFSTKFRYPLYLSL
jgi:hypothetical protein